MKQPARLLATLALAFLAFAPMAHAQTAVAGAPATIDYQGTVLDTAGAVLAPTTPINYTMQFRIYDQQTSGNIIWAESQIVTVDKGAFSVRLGSGVPIASGAATEGSTRDLRLAFNTRERYLGLTVVIPGQPTAEITPRLAFLSSPFTLVAERAKLADTATTATVANSVVQGSGTSTLGATTVSGFTLAGPGRINGANVLEFGSGVTGKETNAGKIGYSTFTPGALDIIGAGTTNTNRKIQMIAEGGVGITGPLNVSGRITGDGSGLTGVTATLGDGTVTTTKLANGSVDLDKLVAAVKDALCPPGTIVAYGGNTPPAGWFLCDGANVSRTTYAALFTAISTNFGNAAGDASKFTLPDLRGRFLRGRDGGAGRDPDRASRVALTLGGATGDAVGSLQPFALQLHDHGFKDGYFAQAQPNNQAWPGMTFAAAPSNWGVNSDIEQTSSERVWERVGTTNSILAGATTSSAETRPVNVYVNYIIKY